jgi:sialic acid synthase SpsE
MKAGEPFTTDNLRSTRPGHGLHPRYLEEILDQYAAVDIKRGTPLKWDLIGGVLRDKQ